ncbi:hypothetical protein V2J09_023883 [Rumex salicifolius]
MEPFNQMGQQDNSSSQRANFPSYLISSTISPESQHHHHHHHHHLSMNMGMGPLIHLQPPYFHHQASASNSAVKSEGSGKRPRFQNYPLAAREALEEEQRERSSNCELAVGGSYNNNNNANATEISNNNNSNGNYFSSEVDAMKAKIIAHPQYSNLLQAYMDCQKVGAPPDVVSRLSAMMNEFETRQRSSSVNASNDDPELDQFMEAYCDMLVKYREELTRPVQEAMDFMRRIESQLHVLTNGRARVINSDEKCEGMGSSEEDGENSGGETELSEIDPRAEDRELKNHLLKKYSGYLSSLKQELSKKKKKGKLPKEAQKVALAEATGLDQKQINNWFINQRKRHWKPSEDMQFMVMDGLHPAHNAAALYMEGHYLAEAPYRFGT